MSSGYNETQARREFIDPFFAALGWDVVNEGGVAEAFKDVIHEDSLRIDGSLKAPDYCFCISGKRQFFVEAKKPSVNIIDSKQAVYQLKRYGWSAQLPFSVLTDFEDLVIYDCRHQPDKNEDTRLGRIQVFNYTEYVDNWDEISALLSRRAVRAGALEKLANKSKRKKDFATVDKSFLDEIESWRQRLAENIYQNNTSLSVRALNYVVQQLIDRIVFLRICEDRGVEEYGTLQKISDSPSIYASLVKLFYKADEKYNSGLFYLIEEKGRDEQLDDLSPGLVVDNDVLVHILSRIYYPESPFQFSVIPVEILGAVYEQFLGRSISISSDNSSVMVELKPELRKQGGVYYTPPYIVEKVVDKALAGFLKNKSPSDLRSLSSNRRSKKDVQEVSKLRVVDPACGSGSFLLFVFQYLLDWYKSKYIQEGIDAHSSRLYEDASGQIQLTIHERKQILLSHVYGVDIDSQAVEVTKLSLLLKVLEGESREGVNRQLQLFQERALPSLDKNIKCGNSVISTDYLGASQSSFFDSEKVLQLNAFDWDSGFPEAMGKGGFDIVLGNPPWISLTGRFRNEIHTDAEISYLVGKWKGNTYAPNMYEYFVSLGLSLVREKGWFSFIVPDRLGFNQQFTDLRLSMLSGCTLHELIFRAPFPGVTADTLIFCLQNKKPARNSQIQVSQFGLKPSPVSQSDFLSTLDHRFEFFSSDDERQVIKSIEGNASCIPLSSLFDTTSGFGGKSKLITPEKISESQIQTMKGDSIECYGHRKTYWFEFVKANITGRTTDRAKLGASPKILLRKTGDSIIATFDDSGIYPEQSLYFLYNRKTAVSFEYVLGLLNSAPLNYYYQSRCLTNKDSIAQVKKVDLDALPIPVVGESASVEDRNRCQRVESLVASVLDMKMRLHGFELPHERSAFLRQISGNLKEIDALACQLYGITAELLEKVQSS